MRPFRSSMPVIMVVLLLSACGADRGGRGDEGGGGSNGGAGGQDGGLDGGGVAGGVGGAAGGEVAAGEGEGEGEGEAGEGEGEAEGGEGEGAEGEGEEELICPSGHVPDELFCDSASARGKWDPECLFRFELPCDQPLVCHPPTAECVEQVCPHNTSHCKDQRTREFCNETGSAWLPPSPCAEGLICVESDLNAVCSRVLCQPGTLGCRDEQTVQVCNDNGTDWVLEACGQGQSCDPRQHTCEDRICDPDAARCDDDDPALVWICDDRGISEEQVPCPDDQVCAAGRCEAR